MTFGVDYAWGRPGVPALKAAGVKFAARYLSHDTTGKNLTRAEAQSLSDGGLWIVVVWESTANRALDGYGAGRVDAQNALAQANACGMPSDRPIYFAVDFDAGPADELAINSYLDGAASVLGKDRTGIYGGYYPVRSALAGGHCKWGWQTYAWSGGQWWGGAQLHQYSNDHIIGGVGLDYDEAPTGDYGQWQVGRSPHQQPPAQQEDDMPNGQLAEGKQAITPITLGKKYTRLQFTVDNGLQQLPAAKLRVAVHKGGGNWALYMVTADSAKDEVVVDVTGGEGVSVRREDAGDVHVSYAVVA